MHNPEKAVLTLLRQRGETFTAAESCTGGLIAKRITDLPGASQVFLGGVVSYTNGIKQTLLDVPASTLDICGAVSAPVAEAMAAGAKARIGADWAVSVTGLAGPDGDDRGNPVGTVFIGLAGHDGTTATQWHFTGDRAQIRSAAADCAFELLREALTESSGKGEKTHG